MPLMLPSSLSKSLRGQRGFSLVNMVTGLAIGGIVTASFVGSMEMMNRSKKTADVKAIASTFIDELQNATLKPGACGRNLANGSNVVPAKPGAETEITFGNVVQGMDLGSGAIVKKLALQISNRPAIVVPGADLHSVSGRIEVAIVNGSNNLPLRTRFVPVQLTYDSKGLITSCGTLDSAAKVCEQLDGIWDPTAPAGLECTPTDKCLYGGAWSSAPVGGVDGSGVAMPGFINTFTGAQSCPTGFSAQQTGTVSVARKASKYRVVTDTYGTYTCVRCQTPVKNQASSAPLATGVDLDPSGQGFADTQTSDAKGDQYTNDISTIWKALKGTSQP